MTGTDSTLLVLRHRCDVAPTGTLLNVATNSFKAQLRIDPPSRTRTIDASPGSSNLVSVWRGHP